MAIVVANLMAQVGADTTRFKQGMDDVDARLAQAASNAVTVSNKLDIMRRKATEASAEAVRLAGLASTATTPASVAMFTRRSDAANRRSDDITTHADDLERDAAMRAAVTQQRIDNIAETAREHQVRAFNAIAGAAETAGLIITGSLAAATVVGSGYNNMMTTAAHNTSLTASQVQVMQQAVRQMGMESGADLQQLAVGFQKIENFGFSVADSIKIETQAMHSAVSAGSDMAETSELLAKVMVDYGLGVDDASKAMNTMHVAANLSSLELSQLVHIGGQVYSMASNLGIGFVEASATIVTFTKHSLNSSDAMTQFRNDISKIIHPVGEVRKQIEALKSKTGIDLSKTFTYSGLKKEGLEGAFADIRKAAEKAHYNPQALANVLFPNLRGTIGAMIMASDNGFNTFRDTKAKLNEAFKGNVDPTTSQYNETLKETETQINRLRNSMTLLTADISRSLSPIVANLADNVHGVADWFANLSQEEKQSMVSTVANTGVMLLATGVMGKFAVGLMGVGQTLKAMTGMDTVAKSIGVITGALKANALALGIWGAVAVGAYIVIANLIKWTDEQQHAESKAIESAKASARAFAQSSEQAASNAKSAAGLAKEYENLSKVAKPSNEQLQRKKDIMTDLLQLSPQLVTGLDSEAGKLTLVADYAKKAADQYAELNKQRGRAAAMEVRTDFFQQIDDHGAIQHMAKLIRAGNVQGYQNALNSHVIGPFGLGGLDETGKMLQKAGFDYVTPVHGFTRDAKGQLQGVTRFDPTWVHKMLTVAAVDDQKYADAQKAMNRQAGIASGDIIDTPKHVKSTGPNAPPPLPDKGRKGRDPMEEWRNYILGTEEKLFKLDHDGPSADADWLKVRSKMEERVKGIKTVEQAYKFARVAAIAYDTASNEADTNKAADAAIKNLNKVSGPKRPDNASDLARWEVGDPSKDRWTTGTMWDPLAGKMRSTASQTFGSGNDDEKSGWSVQRKNMYIAAADAKQAAADAKKAKQEWTELWKAINAPAEREKTIAEQVIDKIKGLPALYADLKNLGQVGVMLTNGIAGAAQSIDDKARQDKVLDDFLKSEGVSDWMGGAASTKPQRDYIKSIEDIRSARLDQSTIAYKPQFGQDNTEDMRAHLMSIQMLGEGYDGLTESVKNAVAMSAHYNAELETANKLQQIADGGAHLAALKASASLGGGQSNDFARWMLKTQGVSPDKLAGGTKFNGLGLNDYSAMFQQSGEHGTEADQAASMERMRTELEKMTRSVGMVRNSSKEAQLAWEYFGVTVDRLTPEMRAQLDRLVPEFEKLDSVRRVERQWAQAASTLEGIFTNTFTAVLEGHADFWKTFTKQFESAVIGIIASESAKELIRLGKSVLHPDTKGAGQGKDKDKSSMPGTQTVSDRVLGSISETNPLPVKIMADTTLVPTTPTTPGDNIMGLPGGIPGIPNGMPGVPGGAGPLGGGVDGAVKWGASQLFGAAAGPWAMGIMGLDQLTGGHIGKTISKFFSGLFATGGRAAGGRAAIVGDGGDGSGAEMLVPTSDVNIIPADMTARIRAVMTGQTTTHGGQERQQNVYLTEHHDYSGGVVFNDAADVERVNKVKNDNVRTKLRMLKG